MDIKESILELVGHTPLVRIRKLNPNSAVDLVAKLEWYNPLGSVKERIALRMIESAIADGRLTKDRTIIEDKVVIGRHTLLVAPVRRGARSATGAGAVGNKDVPPDSLAVGMPARITRRRKAPK